MDIIPQISSKYFKAKCVCRDSVRCGQISRSFKDLKDLRGSFVQFPMNNGSQRFYVQNAIKTKKAKCFSSYLKILNPFETCSENESVALIGDRRNRKKKGEDDINCVKQKGIMRKRVFVALHHFHPRILDPRYGITKVECNGKRFKLPDLVPIDKLEYGGLMEYYSPNDRYDQHRSLIVPNYPLSKSEEDFSQLYSSIQQVLPYNSKISMKSSPAPSKRSREDEDLIANQAAKSKFESWGLAKRHKSLDERCVKHRSLMIPNCPLSTLEEDLTNNYASFQRVLPQNLITSLKSSLTPSKRSQKDVSLIANQSAKRFKLCNTYEEHVKDVRTELKSINDMCGALESMRPRTIHVMGAHCTNVLHHSHIDTLSYKNRLASDLAIVANLTDASLFKARLINSTQRQLLDMQRDCLVMELSLSMQNLSNT